MSRLNETHFWLHKKFQQVSLNMHEPSCVAVMVVQWLSGANNHDCKHIPVVKLKWKQVGFTHRRYLGGAACFLHSQTCFHDGQQCVDLIWCENRASAVIVLACLHPQLSQAGSSRASLWNWLLVLVYMQQGKSHNWCVRLLNIGRYLSRLINTDPFGSTFLLPSQ